MIGNRTGKAIARIREVCEAVAAGNFEARIQNITEKGALGETMYAINMMIDRTDAYMRETRACLNYIGRNKYYRLIPEKGMVGAFYEAAVSINKATWSIKGRHDKFEQIANNFDQQMKNVVASVSSSIDELHEVSESVSHSSNVAKEQTLSVAAGAEEASANMQGVAGAADQLTSSINEINHQMVQSSEITDLAVQKSRQMSVQIASLTDASQKIENVIGLIKDIAAQTNLLALNATIEAARAGEAGKGFAVVAQEVKTLANQTAKATEDTSSQIENIQKATRQAVQANEEISVTIEQVNAISTTIAAAVEEQSAATMEIARNVEQAAAGTSEVCSGITFVRDATEETQKASASVIKASETLCAQEGILQNLRDEMHEFIEEIKKVG
ncbi:MAG: methyl-accepting chemotaxis protein [Rhizobiales bacterium]|nr:methyl-accepting chemotaxis protein [Hyphomicrobiales bacterium]